MLPASYIFFFPRFPWCWYGEVDKKDSPRDQWYSKYQCLKMLPQIGKFIQAEQMRTKNADSISKSALHVSLKQGTLIDLLMLLCLIRYIWKKWAFPADALEVCALTVTKETWRSWEVLSNHSYCLYPYLSRFKKGCNVYLWVPVFRAGDFSSHKGSRVGSGNTGNSAPFVLMLRAGKHLPPRTPLKLKCVFPASVYSPGNWQTDGLKTVASYSV